MSALARSVVSCAAGAAVPAPAAHPAPAASPGTGVVRRCAIQGSTCAFDPALSGPGTLTGASGTWADYR